MEVVDHGKDGGLEAERNPIRADETTHGNEDDQGDVEPVDMLPPVAPGNGLCGDVRLLIIRGGRLGSGRGRGGCGHCFDPLFFFFSLPGC